MRKNIVLYFIAFALLGVVFFFFEKAYQELNHYSELANRNSLVQTSFQNLKQEINNAAIINPDLLKATDPLHNDLFFTNSLTVIKRLDTLKSAVRDTANIAIANKIDPIIRRELPWILNSNVPDSIVHHRSAEHVASLQSINSLIGQGLVRTDFLLQTHKAALIHAVTKVTAWMIIFIILSATLIIYAAIGFLKQTSKAESAAKQLDSTEKKFHHILDNMIEGGQIHDMNWRYLYVNDALLKYSHYTREELIGYTVMEKYPGIEQTPLFEVMQRCMKERISEHTETEFVFPNGTKTYFELSIQPIPEGIFILSVDISERKRAELHQTLFASIVDSSDDAILSKDLNGIITGWNHGAEKMFGYTSQEMVGQPITTLIPDHLQHEETLIIEKINKGEYVDHYETVRIRKDGKVIDVSITVSPLKDISGKIMGASKICRDVTEQKEAKEKLIKANRLYAFVSGINQSIVHIKDKNELLQTACHIAVAVGQFKLAWIGFLNANGKLDIVSLSGEESMLNDFGKYSGMDFTSILLRSTSTGRALSVGGYAVCNNVLIDPAMLPWKEENLKNGIMSNISLPIKKFGKVIGIFGFSSDTENYFDEAEVSALLEVAGDISFAIEVMEKDIMRRESEAHLIKNETRLSKAQSMAHMGHWELDLATGIAEWSAETCRIYGLNPEDNNHSLNSWLSLMHVDDIPMVKQLLKEQRENFKPTSFEHRIIRKDGATRHIHTESKFEFDASGKSVGLYGVSQDITEQKAAADQLLKANELFKLLAENASDLVALHDLEGKYLYVSPSSEKILGYKPEELIGISTYQLLHPDDIEQISNGIHQKSLSGEMNQVAQARLRCKNGEYIWMEATSTPIFDEDKKNVIKIQSVARDINDRKKAEAEIIHLNETLEERVQQRTADLTVANKDLEAFTSTVSHDLRAPVRAVTSFARIIQQDYGDRMDAQEKELFSYIEDNGKRMNAIIDDLLKLAKYGNERLKLEQVDMTRLVEGIWANIGRTNAHNAKLDLKELENVTVDMSMLEQVVVNFLSNAIKYSSKKEKPVVSVWCEKTNKNVTFYFKDNGAGFDMKNYARLFGAFQRLHSSKDFEGTGVGLTLVKRVIEKHGGTVGADAKVGEGATFYFTLPLAN